MFSFSFLIFIVSSSDFVVCESWYILISYNIWGWTVWRQNYNVLEDQPYLKKLCFSLLVSLIELLHFNLYMHIRFHFIIRLHFLWLFFNFLHISVSASCLFNCLHSCLSGRHCSGWRRPPHSARGQQQCRSSADQQHKLRCRSSNRNLLIYQYVNAQKR